MLDRLGWASASDPSSGSRDQQATQREREVFELGGLFNFAKVAQIEPEVQN